MEFAMKAPKQLPGGLPTEIWYCILSILDDTDHSSLKSVVLCSSTMYNLAAPKLFRTLYLECHGNWFDDLWGFTRRVDPTYLCIHVKAIIVVRPAARRPRSPGLNLTHFPNSFIECLCRLFNMAENLRDFFWWHEKYMPGEILYKLYRYRPQAHVYIASSKTALCERINQLKHTSAPHLSCVRSIEAEWCDGEYDEPIRPNAARAAHYPAQLKNILSHCQNLESLALVRNGRYRVHRSEVWPGLERKETEADRNDRSVIMLEEDNTTIPQVKNLHLRGMRFGARQSQLWAKQLRWQSIKHLCLVDVNWTHLLPKLTNKDCFHALEALEVSTVYHSTPEFINQFHAFLEILPSLKMFIGYGFPQDTLAVLAAHHSNSLRDLRFRDQTKSYRGLSDYSRGPPFPSSIHNLDKLFTQFPNLHSLGLRVDWTLDEELPYDLIANIVSQSRIRHLELNLPGLCRDNTASWPYPAADKNACEALAQSLDEISADLQSLYITIGNWYPYTPGWRAPFLVEAYLIGERDYAELRFRNIRQFIDRGKSRREGDFVPRVPPWVMKGDWPSNLRQDIDGRISNIFCGKMSNNPNSIH